MNNTQPIQDIEQVEYEMNDTTTLPATSVVTAFKSTENVNKRIDYSADAKALTKVAKASIYYGVARSVDVSTPTLMKEMLELAVQESRVAIALSRFKGAIGKEIFSIRTKGDLQQLVGKDGDTDGVQCVNDKMYAARSKESMERSDWILLDADNPPGIPDEWAAMDIQERAEFWEPLLPGLSKCTRIELRSSGSRVHHKDEPEKCAAHALVQVSNPELIDAMKAHLQVGILDGFSFGFDKHSKATREVIAVENRSVFDLAVFGRERLIFTADPFLMPNALTAGYVYSGANIQIINPDGGKLDISKIKMPTKKALKAYSIATGSETKLNDEGHTLSSTVFGVLTGETPIDNGSEIKALNEWIAGMGRNTEIRCQTPFRPGSVSMAGILHHNADGSVHLYDFGGAITYPKMNVKPVNKVPDVPDGYSCNKRGVYQVTDDPKVANVHLCEQPVSVEALTRNEDAVEWGLSLVWNDYNGDTHRRAIPRTALHSKGNEVVNILVDGGVIVMRGREDVLAEYLSLFRPQNQMISTVKTGWHGDAFVLPGETINQPAGAELIYQPDGFSSIAKTIKRGGSFDEWKAGMKKVSPTVLFFVTAKLAAPVRYKVGEESGGFHGYRKTSQGKTTTLQAAASVVGCGADPSRNGGNESSIQRWNTTSNALEGVAEATNDVGMDIDEIGEGDGRDFGATIYKVTSGTGKARMNRGAKLMDNKSWRTSILSMGEVGVSAFIESAGGTVKGGMMVRMLDIDLEAMPDMFSDGDDADAMKALCAEHYGHALPEFLMNVPDLTLGWKTFDFESVGKAITDPAKRARKRFALVAHTGFLAVDAGILPWTKAEALGAVQMAYKAWHDNLDIVSDVERGVVNIRAFIQRHAARFQDDERNEGSRFIPSNRAGWIRKGNYLFFPEVFKEACNGAGEQQVKRQLKSMGLLHTSDGRLSARVRGDDAKLTTVIEVKGEILDIA